MARRVAAYGMVGLLVVFAAILVAVPIVMKWTSPVVSGFEDLSCEEGRKPCPEGYFCEQRSCVQILPKYNIDQVKPGAGARDY